MQLATPAATAFVEDYTYLREAGLDHTEIAQRLGIRRESLIRRISRHHCHIPEREETRVLTTLNTLIHAGEPFMVYQHFGRYEKGAVDSAIKRARAEGRIHPAGWACDGLSRTVRVWQPAADTEAQEVA